LVVFTPPTSLGGLSADGRSLETKFEHAGDGQQSVCWDRNCPEYPARIRNIELLWCIAAHTFLGQRWRIETKGDYLTNTKLINLVLLRRSAHAVHKQDSTSSRPFWRKG
jgi:hypothetical protein